MLDAILTLFFFWVHFAPLTRGSAACGYALVHALLLSVGWQVRSLLSLLFPFTKLSFSFSLVDVIASSAHPDGLGGDSEAESELFLRFCEELAEGRSGHT